MSRLHVRGIAFALQKFEESAFFDENKSRAFCRCIESGTALSTEIYELQCVGYKRSRSQSHFENYLRITCRLGGVAVFHLLVVRVVNGAKKLKASVS